MMPNTSTWLLASEFYSTFRPNINIISHHLLMLFVAGHRSLLTLLKTDARSTSRALAIQETFPSRKLFVTSFVELSLESQIWMTASEHLWCELPMEKMSLRMKFVSWVDFGRIFYLDRKKLPKEKHPTLKEKTEGEVEGTERSRNSWRRCSGGRINTNKLWTGST